MTRGQKFGWAWIAAAIVLGCYVIFSPTFGIGQYMAVCFLMAMATVAGFLTMILEKAVQKLKEKEAELK